MRLREIVCLDVLIVASVRHRHDTVSERLRRWTRNPLGSARRGSNPLGVVLRYYEYC